MNLIAASLRKLVHNWIKVVEFLQSTFSRCYYSWKDVDMGHYFLIWLCSPRLSRFFILLQENKSLLRYA